MSGRADDGGRGAVFEANLAALMRRAWRPAAPDAFTRERLVRLVVECAAERARGPRVLPFVLALAASLLAVVGASLWWSQGRPWGERDAGPILARGEVALRASLIGRWCAAEDAAAARGSATGEEIAIDGPLLEVATPAGAGTTLAVGEQGRLAVPAETRLRAWSTPAAAGARDLVVELFDGGLELAWDGAAGADALPWIVATPTGRVVGGEGARVELELVADDTLRVELTAGRAWLLTGLERRPLPAGRSEVRAGALHLPADVATVRPPASSRVAVGPEGGDALPADGPRAAAEPNVASLSGSVLRAEDGSPLDEFRVVLMRRELLPKISVPRERVFTGAAGRFEWADLKEGTYRVFVAAEGLALVRHEGLDVVRGRASEVPVSRLETGATVRGVVVSAESGEPLAGALVISEPDTAMQVLESAPETRPAGLVTAAVTRPDGSFELPHLSHGSQLLRASLPGHAPRWSGDFEVAEGESVSGLLFELTAGGSIRGTLRRPDATPWTATYLVASRIHMGGDSQLMTYAPALTDEQGRFVMEHLAEGLYVMVHLGDEPGTGKSGHPGVVPVQVREGDVSTVTLGPGEGSARLRGQVLDARGRPRGGLQVSLELDSSEFEGWRMTRADEQGHFVFDGLDGGRYRLYVGSDVEYDTSAQGEVELAPGEDLRHDLRLPDGFLAGTVRFAGDGTGVFGVAVVLERLDAADGERYFAGKTLTDGEGRWRLSNLEPGLYRVSAHPLSTELAVAFAPDLRIVRGEPAGDVDLVLVPAGTAEIVIRDLEGRPIAGALVVAIDERGRTVDICWNQRSVGDGRLQGIGLAPGRWTFVARHPDHLEATTAATLEVGTATPVPVVMSPAR